MTEPAAATVVCAPHSWPQDGRPIIFLAGSIDMGGAAPWQDQAIAALVDLPIVILNPRRPDWDSSWRQSIDDPRFREQVEWELAGLEAATVVAMYFDPATASPITLFELGLCALGGRLVVGCPAGFWRKGNVEVVSKRFEVPLVSGLEPLIRVVRDRLGV